MLRKSISSEIINKLEKSLFIFSSRSTMVLFFNFITYIQVMKKLRLTTQSSEGEIIRWKLFLLEVKLIVS